MTASVDGTARVWDIAPSEAKLPEWLPEPVVGVTGQLFNKNGILESTQTGRVKTIGEIRRKLEQQPGDDNWTLWGRWFLASREARTVSPFSKMTVPNTSRS